MSDSTANPGNSQDRSRPMANIDGPAVESLFEPELAGGSTAQHQVNKSVSVGPQR